MVKRNGETVEYRVTLNIPHLRKKINKTCANRPVSCVNGEKPSDFGSLKELAYRCVAALGRRACPLSLAPLASSPKLGAFGTPGNRCCSHGPDLSERSGPCPHCQQMLASVAEPGHVRSNKSPVRSAVSKPACQWLSLRESCQSRQALTERVSSFANNRNHLIIADFSP